MSEAAFNVQTKLGKPWKKPPPSYRAPSGIVKGAACRILVGSTSAPAPRHRRGARAPGHGPPRHWAALAEMSLGTIDD